MTDREVDQGDVRPHAQRDLGRGPPHHARSQDHHVGRRHAGAAAQQNALASQLVEQQAGTHRHRQAARQFGHAGEHRGAALLVLDDLHAHGGHLAGLQRSQILGPDGGQSPEGQHQLLRLQQLVFVGQGGLDAHHQLGPRDGLHAAEGGGGSRGLVVRVGVPGVETCPGLHPHPVAELEQHLDPRWG
jgi:hypothetical protein